MLRSLRYLLSLVVLATGSVQAAEVAASLSVDPPRLQLRGPDARWTLLVDRPAPDGRPLDASAEVTFTSSDPAICTVDASGLVVARANGAATVTVAGPKSSVTVPVSVIELDAPRRFNFENDITPLLTRYSCNYSGCHGKAEGQNGFKLSVFGFDPMADYLALTHESRGRRVFPAAPDQSLLLLKASGLSPHGGGVRIAPGSREYLVLRDWIAAGMPIGTAEDPQVESIRLSPRERVLDLSGQQRLRVIARWSDGIERDVTSLSKFQSNRESIASVDEEGLVRVGQTPGQVAIMATYMGQVDVFSALVPRVEPLPSSAQFVEQNFIDPLVHRKLRQLRIAPSEPCDDATYLRRVTLDITGRLPTAEEARAFLADTSPTKRAQRVDALWQTPDRADFWALKWADLLRVERQALGHKLAHDYYQWIREQMAADVPVDDFARAVLTAEGPFSEAPQGALYRVVTKPGELASTVSQVFLGVRIACAECHHHPHDRWSQQDYYGMTAFFAQINRKSSPRGEALVALGDPATKHPRTGATVIAHALGEPEPTELTVGDRRQVLASWLASPQNPWFARHIANRVWAHFLGRGIVEPVDDVRATNPPSNPALLDALAQHLIDHRFDVRSLVRVITASATYQRSTTPNASNERDEQNYSRALFKRLDAEVLLDAVCDVTGVPEKFQGVGSGSRAVQLWDSRVSHYFLRLFGRPNRTTACTCERSVEPSVSQVLHLLNAPALQAKLEHQASRVRVWAQTDDPTALVDELYLTFYARHPSPAERDVAVEYLRASADRRQGVQDLAWSFMNTLEFVFNH